MAWDRSLIFAALSRPNRGTLVGNRAKCLTGRAPGPYITTIPEIASSHRRRFPAARFGAFGHKGDSKMPVRQHETGATENEWLDQMVTKLQAELQKQLHAVTQAKNEDEDWRARAADARTLSVLERTLERLARVEREREAARERKVARHDKGARAALERRLDKLLGAGKPGPGAGKPGR